jgi:hypothetical protein
MGCNCLCGAAHTGNVCDPDAPRALVHVNAAGSVLDEMTGQTERVVQTCLPCAEAFEAENPRWVSTVVLPEPEDEECE